MTPQAKPRVFLSYARQDQSAVRQIYQFLVDHGCDPWLDVETLLPGQDWAYEIERAIQQTDYFLACLSNHAVDKRGYVQAELKKGLDACLMIPQGEPFLIPVRLEDCPIPYALAKYHSLDWFAPHARGKLLQVLGVEDDGDPPPRPDLLYANRDGLTILMVQTYADRPEWGGTSYHITRTRQPLRKVLKVFGSRLAPIPAAVKHACLQDAAAAVLDLEPDVIGMGGTGGTMEDLRAALMQRGCRAAIDFWGRDAGLDAEQFLQRYHVLPPY